jgi:hypothetical protein
MKVWYGFGSEHSSNLVMIGRFKEARDAEQAKEIIDRLIDQVSAEPDVYRWDAIPQERYYSNPMYELLSASKIYNVGPAELEQLTYDVNVIVQGSEVVVTTDEIEVSAFLKILIDKGARVEVYSAHDYPNTDHGRGK